jgi:chromosome segregation ATPase
MLGEMIALLVQNEVLRSANARLHRKVAEVTQDLMTVANGLREQKENALADLRVALIGQSKLRQHLSEAHERIRNLQTGSRLSEERLARLQRGADFVTKPLHQEIEKLQSELAAEQRRRVQAEQRTDRLRAQNDEIIKKLGGFPLSDLLKPLPGIASVSIGYRVAAPQSERFGRTFTPVFETKERG